MERECTNCRWNDWSEEPPADKSCLNCEYSWEPSDKAREQLEIERIESKDW